MADDVQIAQEREVIVAALIRRLDDAVVRLTGLSWVGFDVLRVTCAHGHIGVRELAHRAGMPGQPLGSAVDLLIARHLTVPIGDPSRASSGLAATGAGRGLVRSAGSAIGAQERCLLRRLSAVLALSDGLSSADVSRPDHDRLL